MTATTKTPIKTAVETAWVEQETERRRVFEQEFAAQDAALKEAQKQEAAAAAEHKKLVSAWEATDKRLNEVLRSAETDLQVFAGVCQAVQIAANEHYNAGIPLGLSNGVSSAVRDRLSDHISHVLRVEANLPAFEQSMSPSGRSPLGEPAAPYQSNMTERAPLREQKNIYKPFTPDDPGYPGQLPTNRPIIQRFLRGDDGEWVEVPVGAYLLPGDEP